MQERRAERVSPHLPRTGVSSFRNKKFGRSTLFLVRFFNGNEIIEETTAPGVCVLLIGFSASRPLFCLAVQSPWHESGTFWKNIVDISDE